MISSIQAPVHHENIQSFIPVLLFPWFFTRLKKKKKSCNKERAEHCLSFLIIELELQVTQIEEKLNSVKCLSSLGEWVKIFLGGDSHKKQCPSGDHHKVKSTEYIASGSSTTNKVDLYQAEQRKLPETDRSWVHSCLLEKPLFCKAVLSESEV